MKDMVEVLTNEGKRKILLQLFGEGDGGGSEGGNGGGTGSEGGNGGSGGDRVDRVVNVYIGNSTPYSVPTNEGGQRNIEAIAREVLRLLELQRNQLGY